MEIRIDKVEINPNTGDCIATVVKFDGEDVLSMPHKVTFNINDESVEMPFGSGVLKPSELVSI